MGLVVVGVFGFGTWLYNRFRVSKTAILELLADGPYTEADLVARSDGRLRIESAGAHLRLLEEQGLIVCWDEDGVLVYALR